jgi:hypothetical protein
MNPMHAMSEAVGGEAVTKTYAVVAGDECRAKELVRCFARQGERAQICWYPDARALISANENPRFEALILFASEDCARGDAEELELRGAYRGFPIYRL